MDVLETVVLAGVELDDMDVLETVVLAGVELDEIDVLETSLSFKAPITCASAHAFVLSYPKAQVATLRTSPTRICAASKFKSQLLKLPAAWFVAGIASPR